MFIVDVMCEVSPGKSEIMDLTFDSSEVLANIRGSAKRIAKEGFWVDNTFYPPQKIYWAKVREEKGA